MKTLLDLAQSDVHVDGAVSVPKGTKTMAKPKKKPLLEEQPKKRAKRSLRIRAELADGGSLHVRHLSDEQIEGGKIMSFPGLVELKASDESRVWIQLAKVGQFRGHSAGAFELSAQVFDEVVRNFRATENRRIPIDFEHASEADPTDGAIPVAGAPAQGWIVDLDNRGDGGLWGLVEWGSLAREYIKNGQYRFFSPAIRFNSRDRVSGKPVGARMTSGALTNNPFLDGMMPLVAKDFDGGTPARTDAPVEMSGSRCYSTHEYMPRVRAALRMPELSHAAACRDALGTLREMYAACGDANGMHQGVRLGDYMTPLRDLAGANLSSTWDEVFDIVEDLIDAAIDEHELEYHGGPPPEESAAEASLDDDEELGAELSARQPENEMEKEKVAEFTSKIEALEAAIKAGEEKLAAVTAENEGLKKFKAEAEETALQAEVDTAYATYKDAKRLTDADRDAMVITLRHAPEAFRKAYPKIDADKQHLLRTVIPARANDARVATPAVPDLVTLADKLQQERAGLSREDALIEAEKQVRGVINSATARR